MTPFISKKQYLILQLLWAAWLFYVSNAGIAPNITEYDVEPLLQKYDQNLMVERYERWIKRHQKEYKDRDEWSMRFGVYQSNVQFIDYMNIQQNDYKLSDNKFTDMTNDEFKQKYMGYKRLFSRDNPGYIHHKRKSEVKKKINANKIQRDVSINDTRCDKAIDWRKLGAVTKIKDQGTCGSCWAFSAVAAVEGINQIKTGKLEVLSEQELVSCDVKGTNKGCNGGLMDDAFKWIQKNGGLTLGSNYPYTGTDDKCDTRKCTRSSTTITGYKDVPPKDENALQVAVSKQPISVAIDAGGFSFQFYKEGIFTGYCGNQLNHGVTLVGYGGGEGIEPDDSKYWIVKNSWGTGWGEAGYIRMKRGVVDGGICGIAMQASYPLKSK